MRKIKKYFSPETTIILWDLHEVILTKNTWNWLRLCFSFNRKKELIRKLDKHALRIALTFMLERIRLINKALVSEELITIARNGNNDALVELITTVCSSYAPIKGTVAVMEELSALGYTHHLGSNIGQTVFDACHNKFDTIFKHFKAYTIPFYTDEKKIIKKPNPHFFKTHLTTNNIRPENVIFIDDKKANVVAAQLVGIHAIHFINPTQLRQELHSLTSM